MGSEASIGAADGGVGAVGEGASVSSLLKSSSSGSRRLLDPCLGPRFFG
jgi:hypothetical protein